MYHTIEIEHQPKVTTVWLNRPEVRNAFNDLMVQELHAAFIELENDPHLRVVVLRGRGNVFCSGADLAWMQKVANYDYEKNIAESLSLAQCINTIFHFSRPVVALAQGAVYGGGNGLLAAADIAIASKNTLFAFSEVTIGLVPAVISPYIVKKTGYAKATEWMLTGNKFTSEEALRHGLVNMVMEDADMEPMLAGVVSKLVSNSPSSLLRTKELLHSLSLFTDEKSLMKHTAKIIAQARVSSDGQEGMNAFIEKRKPIW